jgi:PGF-CTERM protein
VTVPNVAADMQVERRTSADVESCTSTHRGFLVGAVTAGGVAAGVTGVSTQTATAQATTGASEGAEITAPLVVPEDAPTLGNDDFTGLLLTVIDQGKTDASDTDVASCEGLEADRIISYQLELTDERDDSEDVVEATGFAARSNDAIQPGSEYIVNTQEPCGDGYRHLALEAVTRSSVDVDTETTSAPVPGFGAGTAVAGLAAAAIGAAWQSVRS